MIDIIYATKKQVAYIAPNISHELAISAEKQK